MVEPIITEAALVGGSAWFANKVFGPSAGAIGDSLKVYFQSQVPKIFAVAQQKVAFEDLELSEVSPGLLTRMIIDASSSADDDDIRDWWSSLFIEAAIAEDNVHSTLSDMMATIGPVEAQLLSELYRRVEKNRPSQTEPWRFSKFLVDHMVHEFMRTDVGYRFPIDQTEVGQVNANIENFTKELPALPSSWSVPIRTSARIDDNEPFHIITLRMEHAEWYQAATLAYEILERARIIRISRHELPAQTGRSGWVEFVEFTQLGMAFYEASSGLSRNWISEK